MVRESARRRLAWARLLLLASPVLLALGCSSEAPPDANQSIGAAESLLAQGKHAEAIEVLLGGLRQEPMHAGIRWRLGQLYLDVGAADFAESHLAAALDSGMSPSSVLPLLAKAHLIGDDLDALFEMKLPPALSPDARAAVLALQAEGRVRLKQFQAAEALLQEADAAVPGSEAVGLARARIFLAQGRPARAQAVLRALLVDYPASWEAPAMLADLVRDAGHLDEAEQLYGRALERGNRKAQLHFLRGEVRLDLGLVDGAEEDTRAVEATAANSFAAFYLRARLLLLNNEFEKALTAFTTANKLQPSHPGTLLYGGIAAYTLGQTNLAEDWLSRVVKEYPGNVRARLVLGAMCLNQGRYAEAEGFLRPVPAAIPDNPLPRRLLAASLIAQDKAAEAVPLLKALVSTRPADPRAQLDLSVALVLSGAKQRGAAALDGLVARHPDYRPAYEYLIAFHVREHQWDEARRWSERFHEHYPDDASPLYFKGEVLLEAGRKDAAREAFAQALTIDPSHPDANMRLAVLALEQGDVESAAAHYAQILAQDPENLDALMGQARLAADAKRADAAVDLLRQAVSAHPKALAPRMALARELLAQGEAQRAADALQDTASPTFRHDPAYLQLLAESLVSAQAPQQAAEVARELVALRPDSLDAYGLYAQILTLLDDKVALEETLKQMLTIDPAHAPARLELVRLDIATERYEVGERLLSPLLQSLDRPPLADLLYGLILTATDRAGQAVAPLRHAHERLGSQRTLLALANAEALSGQSDAAIEREREWLTQHPDAVEVRVNLAGHLADAQHVSEAIAEYRKVVAAHPKHVVALNNLAWYTLGKDPKQAVDYARRALDAKPDSLEVAHTLVAAEVEAGEWRNAELTLDRALARYPADSGLMWLSARVLHHKGRPERAMQRLERLLDDDLADAERERARVLLTQIQDELRAKEAEKLW